jgi:hypothetical protein
MPSEGTCGVCLADLARSLDALGASLADLGTSLEPSGMSLVGLGLSRRGVFQGESGSAGWLDGLTAGPALTGRRRTNIAVQTMGNERKRRVSRGGRMLRIALLWLLALAGCDSPLQERGDRPSALQNLWRRLTVVQVPGPVSRTTNVAGGVQPGVVCSMHARGRDLWWPPVLRLVRRRREPRDFASRRQRLLLPGLGGRVLQAG